MVAMSRTTTFTLLGLVSLTALGCGYSEDEWQAQLAKYGQLESKYQTSQQELQDTRAKLEKTEAQLKAEQQRVASLEKDLEAAGFDLNKLKGTLAKSATELDQLEKVLAEREKALAEYKARAAQLERIKARFDLLRKKLQALTNLGLQVVIRNNRMVISLPGDVLFPSGQTELKKGGFEVLDQVATIIRDDSGLKARDYQVAGHTDNVALKGGIYKDNWGLSLMRARSVLVYLIDPEHGQLPRDHWSAAGFGDTDPIAENESKEGKQKNRRCDLVVVPSAEEMLDLQAIAK